MAYDRCKKCEEWGLMDRHRCPPEWACWDETGNSATVEEPVMINARGSDTAAERYAKRYYDNAGESPKDGEELVVCVKLVDKVEKYTVTASWDVDYNAEVKE